MQTFKNFKNFYIISLFLICLIPLVFYTFIALPSSNSKRFFKVVIDAGHGGIDGGSSGTLTGVSESVLNLEIAKKLKKVLEKVNINVIMTRTNDDGLYDDTSQGFKVRDLKKRVQIINESKPDLVVSIHLNIYQKEYRRGAQVFYAKNNPSSIKLAKNIQTHLNLLPESKKMYDALYGDYYLLNNSKPPAVIVECGFLSNNEEESLLQTENYQNKIANAIKSGIVQYLSC